MLKTNKTDFTLQKIQLHQLKAVNQSKRSGRTEQKGIDSKIILFL